jgi:hypothetical protein
MKCYLVLWIDMVKAHFCLIQVTILSIRYVLESNNYFPFVALSSSVPLSKQARDSVSVVLKLLVRALSCLPAVKQLPEIVSTQSAVDNLICAASDHQCFPLAVK